MSTWDVADGDPVHPGVFTRLDLLEESKRCEPPDPALFQLLADRLLVAFQEMPDEAALAKLSVVARVRWLYLQLRLAEVDATDEVALAALPFVAAVAPAWTTLGDTRGLVVGLNSLCAFASTQAKDPEAFYRHPSGIGYPILTSRSGRKELDLDPSTELATPPALVPVVNMSLGTVSVVHPTAPNDVVNLATASASGQVLVVMAAGNCGRRSGDSMSAWARPDWVLSVGATEDAEGTRIAAYSSRGEPGPDLVAHGQSALDAKKLGTSFAAPRVTFLARLVVAAFCQLGREVLFAQGGTPIGVPAIGYGIIDDFDDDIWWGPESATAFQALPLVGVRPDAVTELVQHTNEALTVRMTPAIVREVLISSARPVPGASTSQAGAGFIDRHVVIDRLAAVTGGELWTWFGTGPPPPDEGQWDAVRPFDADELRDLADVVAITGPTVKFDYKSGHWLALPQSDARMREQHPRGWPIDLAGIRL